MTTTIHSAATRAIPELENGDRLTRAEFERRYEAMPGVRAELIEGVVYIMASPVRAFRHSQPHSHLVGLLFTYIIATPGVQLFDNPSLRIDLDNEPQPDVVLSIESARGGRSLISADDYLEGSPELVAEVASSSASIDLGAKFLVYRRHGIGEYLVWRVLDRTIDWFVLRDGRYGQLAPDSDGLRKSPTFPGLWLDSEALTAGDLPKMIAALNRGLASPEHAAFVEGLGRAKADQAGLTEQG